MQFCEGYTFGDRVESSDVGFAVFVADTFININTNSHSQDYSDMDRLHVPTCNNTPVSKQLTLNKTILLLTLAEMFFMYHL